jgi:glutathionylspermidine synthase
MVIAEHPTSTPTTAPLQAADELSPCEFQNIRRQLILDCCKWDPQVGDTATISPFPLFLSQTHWRQLSHLSTLLAAELMSAEHELLNRPDLHRLLGLPRGIRSLLRRAQKIGTTPTLARVLRFDFHWTTNGWQISEVNSDVPGGFTEASELPALLANHYPTAYPAENPGSAWATALAASVPPDQTIALLAAAGFMEDQQVIAYLAQLLNRLGLSSHRASPENLYWQDGRAYLNSQQDQKPLGAIVRFVQAEWLSARRSSPLFVGGQTPVGNPGIAMLTESKRFSLTWNHLSTKLPTWRQLLPTTVDPRDANWRHDDTWLVKSAFCNTGDTVAIRPLLTDRQWRATIRAVRRSPGAWIAQKRFETLPLETPAGPVYPCVGVYTVNGRPAGIYGRYSRSPLIDYAAVDVAILINDA